MVGLEKCSPGDWTLLISFVVGCLIFTFLGIWIINKEQKLKLKAGMKLVKSDIHFNTGNTIKLVGIGLVGGLVSGAFGLGGGSVFGPVLLYLGVAPKVVGATSMYMIMYSTVSSSLMYIIVGTLDIGYGFWISLWSVCGTIIGMKILDSIMKRF